MTTRSQNKQVLFEWIQDRPGYVLGWVNIRRRLSLFLHAYLQPIANCIGAEVSEKLGLPVTLDVMQPLQAFDADGRARTVNEIVQALALGRKVVWMLVNWSED